MPVLPQAWAQWYELPMFSQSHVPFILCSLCAMCLNPRFLGFVLLGHDFSRNCGPCVSQAPYLFETYVWQAVRLPCPVFPGLAVPGATLAGVNVPWFLCFLNPMYPERYVTNASFPLDSVPCAQCFESSGPCSLCCLGLAFLGPLAPWVLCSMCSQRHVLP